jgi:hypothetical protein
VFIVRFYFYINYLELEPTTTTTSLLSSPPEYKNPDLEQKINQNKGEPTLELARESLTSQDMEVVAYYALQDNNVSNILHIIMCII